MRILVVGAGIGGLTFVAAQQDMECTIDLVERASEFQPLGVGIVLHPNGMSVLAELGLDEAVRAAGAELRFIDLIRGEHTLRLSLAEIWQHPEHPTTAIARHELHGILARAALSPGRVRLRMGARVAAMEQCARFARVQFADSTSQDYDLVIGADGVHSGVRQLMRPDAAATPTGLFYIRFPARNTFGLDRETWCTYESPAASFGFIPLGSNRVHCFYQIRTPEDSFAAGDEADFLRASAGGGLLLRAIEARCGPFHSAMAYMLQPVFWGEGVCALLGDAAHCVPPTLSQGGALAMEDALVLARVLRRAGTIREAIEEYERYRRDRVLWMYRMGLSQINSLRRARFASQLDPVIATRHMREIYSRLREAPLPHSSPPELPS